MAKKHYAYLLAISLLCFACAYSFRAAAVASEGDSTAVLSAAVDAANDNSVEEAGYLSITGMMRAMIDLNHFPPSGDAEALRQAQNINELMTQLHSSNAKLMKDRDAYNRVISRLERWAPNVGRDYSPPWSHTSNSDPSDLAAYVEEIKNDKISEMKRIASLLADEEYHSLCCQIFELPSQNEKADTLVERLTEIEKRRDIEGLYHVRSNAK